MQKYTIIGIIHIFAIDKDAETHQPKTDFMVQKYADYISRIEIDSLWSGRKHIVWELDPKVNILSGINGVGKSTILNKVLRTLLPGGELSDNILPGVKIKVVPEDAGRIRYDVIRSFDRPLMQGDVVNKIVDAPVATELDWQLYQLQRKYLDYQVNMGNRIIAILQQGDADAAEQAGRVSAPKKLFQDLIDRLFAETGVILHIDWQQQLIDMIRELNPHVQIVLTTHSPAVIMNGWMDHVTEVNDITT